MASRGEAIEHRRFTVDEYRRMAESGVLSPDERVELIRGIVRPMSPKKRAHVVVSARVLTLLTKQLEGRASVYPEAPLSFPNLHSEPEPDIVACSNPDLAAYGTEKTSPLLVVEVAESSLGFDLGDKALLYAEAGIPEYWVVNVAGRAVERFLAPRNGRFERHEVVAPDGRAVPEAWPDVAIDVAALFEGL